MRILRIYHAGRDPAHRMRERALAALGHEVVLVVPSLWPEAGAEEVLGDEPFRVVELDVRRPGDINRHRHADDRAVRDLLAQVRPDVLDVHEEPVSLVARQWLRAAPSDLPVAQYTAQNIDKRFPPPFAQYERAALARATTLYATSSQAAAVARGKGYDGPAVMLPIGFDDDLYRPGSQSLADPVLTLGLVGRMVPEKGVRDAVRVLAALRRHRPARLLLVGTGPEVAPALDLAGDLGVAAEVDVRPWVGAAELAELYREMHVALIPSRATRSWVEQFGRVITEGQASGAIVAGYRSGSIPEVAGDAGVLVAEADIDALTEQVVALLSDESRFDHLRTLGLANAGRMRWSDVAHLQAELYAGALKPPGPRAVTGRAAAARELGGPARIPGPDRPFALPVLRDHDRTSILLGRVVDAFGRVSR